MKKEILQKAKKDYHDLSKPSKINQSKINELKQQWFDNYALPFINAVEMEENRFESIVDEIKNMSGAEFLKSLVDAGITTPDGKLTPKYQIKP